MVKKRSRTNSSRRNSKKFYESDENESETDFETETSPVSTPPPKRYGLRQRKQPIFCGEFDYEEEDELKVGRDRSDDEEYDIRVDIRSNKKNDVSKNKKTRKSKPRTSEVLISNVEPLPQPEMDDIPLDSGLIDFEDVIRADVVMNKQKAEYDNGQSDIEPEPLVTKSVKSVKPIKEKGRRGRKPKAKIDSTINNVSNTITTTKTGRTKQSQEEDTTLEVQIDPLNFVQSNLGETDPSKANGLPIKPMETDPPHSPMTPTQNGSCEFKVDTFVVDNIEKYVPPELDEKEKEVVLSNEYLLGNSFDMSAEEFLKRQEQTKDDHQEEEEESVPLVNFDDSGSDDDVVIIEKKPEIIVLDDD
ncbi:hypothetical protein ABEB36_000777 [Hypothenemus hampei]|uniref:Uncharacterized protein n=1 Tax=Hypothenemus hampei TaxID=57062 RepID=A0ABD1FD72_HYPHA